METSSPKATTEDCGCAPTPAERAALLAVDRPSLLPVRRRGLLTPVSRRTVIAAAALGVVAVGAAAGPLIPAAFADGYPSWDDVQRAKANEAAKAAQVTTIQGLITSLTAHVASTRAIADQRAGEFYQAQQDYFSSAKRADVLQSQADAQAATAKDAADKAVRVAAQLYRNGGDDSSLELFFS